MICMAVGKSASASAFDSKFDGVWWKNTAKQERLGFVAGFLDCAIYDDNNKRLRYASWDSLEPQISAFFASHPAQSGTGIGQLIEMLGQRTTKTAQEGGEVYREKHGIFDGEYWRQASPEHRLGFIEGYLVCQREYKRPAGTFSQAPAWYVHRISNWYGTNDEDPSAISEPRSVKKIANVLRTLDTSTSEAKPQ